MSVLKQSTAVTRTFVMIQTADHISGLTGASPTVTLSKNGASFGSAEGTVTQIGSGWYKIALTTNDTDTVGDLAYHVTAASGDPTDFVDEVAANVVGDMRIKKNTALANFMFVMTDSTNHNPATGKTVTATRSIDGAAFASCTNSPAEISSGFYKISLSAADLNGTVIALRFIATGCDDRDLTVITQA